MTITSSLPLHPGPPTAWVCHRFYGGPRDGEMTTPMQASDLLGTIRLSGGAYSLQGFVSSGHGMPEAIQAVAMDYAIYEWEAGR